MVRWRKVVDLVSIGLVCVMDYNCRGGLVSREFMFILEGEVFILVVFLNGFRIKELYVRIRL